VISKEEKINPGQAHMWVKKYLESGENGLINKRKPGTPYKGLNLKKELTDLEQLQYENMKLRVENERLKKGYIVEGVGPEKKFIDISNKNMK
jgi:transposase-like protein